MIAAEVEAVLVLAAEAVVLEATDMKDGEAAGGASPAACHVRLAEVRDCQVFHQMPGLPTG